jgi:hypothetical protein
VGYVHAKPTATYASAGYSDRYAFAHTLDPTHTIDHGLTIDDPDAASAPIW